MKSQLEKLLLDFTSIEFDENIESTYLELCKYPYSRFEEICSRILAYFFNPLNGHGLKDLFLKSFFNLKGVKKNNPTIQSNFKNIKVKTEENAEGKRLDLIINSEGFVIGIENKITANLYNPLGSYSKLIEGFHQPYKYKIVLSLKKIIDKNELLLMQNEGFINILYIEFIDEIKNNIGKYLSNQNSQAIYILNDFIKTIENMSNYNYLNKSEDNFFIKNSFEISELIQKNDDFQKRLTNLRCVQYNEIINKLKISTNDDNWWVYQCIGLGINKFGEVKDIGLECYYESKYQEGKDSNENALWKFVIKITAWNTDVWNVYEPKIIEELKKMNKSVGVNKKDDGFKTTIIYNEIFNNDFDEILLSLEKGYEFMTSILKKSNVMSLQ